MPRNSNRVVLPAIATVGSVLFFASVAVCGTPEPSSEAQLSVVPAELQITGRSNVAQLVVTGRTVAGFLCDHTDEVDWKSEDPAIATVTGSGAVHARSDGATVLVGSLGGSEVRVPVEVDAAGPTNPVSFSRHVVPALTKLGCNAGTCHGTPTGKNGFRLSLRGYDPASDLESLTREFDNRRVNRLDPDQSLILRKATAQIPHEGGRRFEVGSDLYVLLRDWIAEGARGDASEAPAVEQLEVFPAERALKAPAESQQLRMTARFTDGTTRDVTRLARFSTTDELLAEVSFTGRVRKLQAGEVTVVAEYLGRMATAKLLFLDPASDFAWQEVPENNYVDRHVFAKLKRLRIQPAPLASDEEFLRRVYLDAIGKLPTPEEAREFFADSDPDKRAKLIGHLLQRPEFADWWAMKWTDRLGCNQRFVGKAGAIKYHRWIRAVMAENMPEDDFVRQVLTAQGGNYSNPPAGFYRRLREPELAAEEVSQLFLGVRLQCARCHNHPGERWTQGDYYGLAAFFTQLRYKDGPFFNHRYDKEETVYLDRDGNEGRRRPTVPAEPRFLGGASASVGDEQDRREVLAQWLTSPDNPFFARAAVNRIWYHLFGRGIVEPVDDLRVTNPPSNPELLEALADDFVEHGFDRKHLIRTILNSRTYQLSSAGASSEDPDGKYFSHARVRLLGSEQLLDSICSAADAHEKFSGFPLGTPAVGLPDGEYQHPFLEAFGRPDRAMACECERDTDTNLGQALELVGGDVVQDIIRSDQGRVARLVDAGRSDTEILDELFLAALSRYPNEEERDVLLPRLESDRRRVVAEDILWALVNHREFLFQH